MANIRIITRRPLNKRPNFLGDMSGKPYQSRLDRQMEVDDSTVDIQGVLETDLEVTVNGAASLFTIKHGLGYKPALLGYWGIKSLESREPFTNTIAKGDLLLANWIDDITNKNIVVGFTASDIGSYPDPTVVVVVRLVILTNAAV